MAVHNLGTIPNAASENANILSQGLMSGVKSITDVLGMKAEARLKARYAAQLEAQKAATDVSMETMREKSAMDIENVKAQAQKEIADKRLQMYYEQKRNQRTMETDRREHAVVDKGIQAYSNMLVDDPTKAAMFMQSDAGKQFVKLIKRVKGSSAGDYIDDKGNIRGIPPQRKMDAFAGAVAGEIQKSMPQETNPWAGGLGGEDTNPNDPAGLFSQ